jgi:hypothetical protein
MSVRRHLEERCPRGGDGGVQARPPRVFECVRGEIFRITGYPDIDEARAAAERAAEKRG